MEDGRKRTSKEKPLTYRQKASLTFVDQEEPAFIQAIKKKIGYREPAKIEDKFAEEGPSTREEEEYDEDIDDISKLAEEERPQIVVANPRTDMSSEQLDKELADMKAEAEKKMIEEGRITFRKPEKRSAASDHESKNAEKQQVKRERREEGGKAKCDSRLLSFGNDEEEE